MTQHLSVISSLIHSYRFVLTMKKNNINMKETLEINEQSSTVAVINEQDYLKFSHMKPDALSSR